MKKNTKRLISLLLALVLVLGCSSAIVAFAEDLVAINEVNFADSVFRQVVSEYYDSNGDGYLSADERKVTSMSVSGMIDTSSQRIKTLKGIEFFPSIKILRCGGIGLEELDVSQLSSLTSLTCQGNRLTSLDVFSNMNLTLLNCSDNDISRLSLSNNVNLKTVYCYANSITELNAQYLENLESLRCDQNELTSLDLTKNTRLVELNCSQNHLTSLDLSSNTLLTDVTNYMIGNQTITLTAALSGESIVVPFTNHGLDQNNYISCSLDEYGDGSCFEYDSFVAYDVAEINDGIDYYCYPKLEGSENMKVHINVIRDSFCQVDFYSSSDMTEKLGKSLVAVDADAVAPVISEYPQCKTLGGWSDSITAVTEDKSVYALWEDAHSYVITAFDGDLATLTCSACSQSYTVSFKACINAKSGDSNFDQNLDVHNDGIINAKDYAKLTKMF